MLFVESLETWKCMDEGVLTSIPDANIGSIFGIGFPPWTGGSAQYIAGYPGGKAGFVARADALGQEVRRALHRAGVAAHGRHSTRRRVELWPHPPRRRPAIGAGGARFVRYTSSAWLVRREGVEPPTLSSPK